MIEPLTDLPAGVLGYRAVGEIHADDYRNVLVPAIEAVIEAGEQVRVVLVFPAWDGMSAGATWEDLKLGAHHLTQWKKIALVTDVEWMVHLTHLFGWMTPGELKVFATADEAQAVEWAAAD